MKFCLFFKDSLYVHVRIVLFQGESYVWQKFWQFTHPSIGGNACSGKGNPTPTGAARHSTGSPPGDVPAVQQGSIINI
jgi:hypothetical protein